MDYKTIDKIYAANDRYRNYLLETIDTLTAEEVKAFPLDEKWSIEQILEHISIVEEGMSKICRKLLTGARDEGLKSEGAVSISDSFRAYAENIDDIKLEAPERVQPTGMQSVADSKKKIVENQAWFENLRPIFQKFDGTKAKFPHPYFGPLSAQDWLVLAGEHTRRHTRQIEKLVAKIRQ
jgi:hypothetical protein